MNSRARRYAGLVVGAGVLSVGIAALLSGGWVRAHPVRFLVLLAAMAAAERFVIHLTLRREALSFSVVEVLATFALLAVPAPVFVLAVSLAVLIGQVVRRRPVLKTAFNAGMYAVCATGAALVFRLSTGPAFHGEGWLGALLGMATFFALNQLVVATMVAFAEGQRVRDVVRLTRALMAMVWAGNVSLGILAHFLYVRQPATVGLLAIPLLLSYTAYAAWVRSRAEGAKMHALYQAGLMLMGGLEATSLAPFLDAVRQMFRAEGAEIVTPEGARAVRILDADGGERVQEVGSGIVRRHAGPLEAYVQSVDARTQLVAPLADEHGVAGMLVVRDHRGAEGPREFPRVDLALLQALANQASSRLSNLALFASVSEESAKLHDIVTNTSDGIYQVTPDRRIITWNPAMERITGYAASEAVGQMCFNVLHSRDGRGVDLCSSDCPILAACASATTAEREAQIMSNDGVHRWIRYTHNAIRDPSGEVTSVVVVVRDVTQERAVQEAKEDFIASVSHELRTPLTPIKGFLLTLLRADEQFSPGDRREVYERMRSQTERLERLVEDLLAVSAMEGADPRLVVRPTDVSALVKSAIAPYQASHPNRGLVAQADPGIVALADSAGLGRILASLIDNALRYAPDSEAILVSVAKEGREVVISVHDRGPGIPHDEQERIFDRFYRIGHHLTREQGGVGLGLFIARRLAGAMGGKLTLTSRMGEGSSFRIHLSAPPQDQPFGLPEAGQSRFDYS